MKSLKKLFAFHFILICCAINLNSTANADERGLTGIDTSISFMPVIVSLAEMGAVPMLEERVKDYYQSPWMKYTDDWELILSDSVTISIPEGMDFAVYFNPTMENLDFTDPTVPLNATQTAAIERAPAWLRSDLYDSFRRFEYSLIADWFAQDILDAPDPYVDEVAFQVANIAPGLLEFYVYQQLLLENAQYVYSADSTLDYVEIVDYGDSNDDDYWSTTVYTIIEENGDTVQVEVDRETYYWYVVHPKLSDETPTYINPETGAPANPPVGVFWRTYFWTHADSGYELLSEQFEGCDFLWAHLTNTAGSNNGAVGLVNSWINNVMDWGAGLERPIQPVRIYALHCGNCGEYSDITAAAGRTALIPTICTTNYCEDHTWNEFWDREWIAWEPVNNYVNSPLVYENSWGKVISAVFNWKGNGYVWTVTDRYSEGVCTLNIDITDSTGKPADGERIIIQSNALWGGFYYATWGITNSEGEVSFILGDDGEDFYLRVDGPLGSFPYSGGVYSVITGSQVGATYTWEYSMEGATPALGVAPASEYPNPLNNYLMEIDYQCEYETVFGTYFTNNEFAEEMDTGSSDFFIANEENYSAYSSLEPAEGFSILDNTASGLISYVLPTDEVWYGVFSSRELSINRPRVKAVVNIYRNMSPVMVNLTPSNPPIIIPEGGGSFDFNIACENNTNEPQTFDLWTVIHLPEVGEMEILNVPDLTIPANTAIDRDRIQEVPSFAPGGEYTYFAYVGDYPWVVEEYDSFTFIKIGADGGDYPGSPSDWICTGQPFTGEKELTGLSELPDEFSLSPAYPNPFNQETMISFSVPSYDKVKIAVYNLLGQEAAVLTDRAYSPGMHSIKWDGMSGSGGSAASGIYLVRMVSSEKQFTEKICLMK